MKQNQFNVGGKGVLVSLVPKCLLNVIKRKGDVTQHLALPLPQLFLDHVAGIKFRTSLYLQKTIKFVILKIKYLVFYTIFN